MELIKAYTERARDSPTGYQQEVLESVAGTYLSVIACL